MAKERNALIIDLGDTFDACNGRWDPRKSYDEIRPEDVGDDYLDRIVMHAAEFYAPYADLWLMFGRGNHEMSIRKHNGVDLTSNLVFRLRALGSRVVEGEYGGWIKFIVKSRKTVSSCINLKYHHGSGGGGPVTRGVIQTNRQAVYLPDADVVVNGHTHDSWVLPIARERLSNKGIVKRDLVWFLRTPTYRDDYGDGGNGYYIEHWGPPKPMGCIWMRLKIDGKTGISFIEAYQDLE